MKTEMDPRPSATPDREASLPIPCPLCKTTLVVNMAAGPQQLLCPVCSLTSTVDPAQLLAAGQEEEEQQPSPEEAEPADEFGRWLAGKPIRLVPVSVSRRMWRSCRSHPLLAGLAGAAVAIPQCLSYMDTLARST